MREQVISALKENKLLVISRGVPREKLLPMAESLYLGGIRLLEITFSPEGNPSDKEIGEQIKLLSTHFQGKMWIGAGTVLTKEQVLLVNNSGGSFIVSPDTNPDVIRETRRLGLVSIPGAYTPTEILTARREGGDFIKLFPVKEMGESYVKIIKAPLRGIPLLGVGNIELCDLAPYVKAGCSGFAVGGGILAKTLLEKEDYGGIRERAKAYTDFVKSL